MKIINIYRYNLVAVALLVLFSSGLYAMRGQAELIAKKRDSSLAKLIAKTKNDHSGGFLIIEIFGDYGQNYKAIRIIDASTEINTTVFDAEEDVIKCNIVDWEFFSKLVGRIIYNGNMEPQSINRDPFAFIRFHVVKKEEIIVRYIVSPADYVNNQLNDKESKPDDPAAVLLLLAFRLSELGVSTLRSEVVQF